MKQSRRLYDDHSQLVSKKINLAGIFKKAVWNDNIIYRLNLYNAHIMYVLMNLTRFIFKSNFGHEMSPGIKLNPIRIDHGFAR